ncbi:MAG: serine hydrolase [SAR324 cluster bacterium]|nr:serine hydrolase [SAR324 cluster bacterium]
MDGTPQEYRWHAEPETLGMAREPLERGMATLLAGCADGRHPGAQAYLSRHGTALLEYACGEARPGAPLTPDSLTAWFSACKPLTAMAIAMLYDQGLLDLDDPVRRFIPAFGNGKEACTIRHVLTHQGGFANAVTAPQGRGAEEIIAEICAYPAEYPPGGKAGYHPTGGWYVLGEIVRVIDGRGIGQYVAEQLFAPLGMHGSQMGIPAERQRELNSRLALVAVGVSEREPFASQAMVDTFNSPAEIAQVNPSGGIRGPARDLGRFYEFLLAGGRWEGRQLIDARTVALFTACHRWDLPDLTLMQAPLPWGLGFGLYGNADVHRTVSRRMFGHSGMVSSVALGDPELGLACAVITTGLLDPMGNARRLREVTGAMVEACTDARGSSP